jgi:hypothetical protein
MLKQSTRDLLEAIERTTKTTNMAVGSRVTKRSVHVDLMQLTVKKSILHVKLRDSQQMNRGHRNKSTNDSHVSNRSKSLLIVMTVLLLKATGNKTHFKALNRAIKADADLVDPLALDQNNKRRVRNKIPSVGTLKGSNPLNYSKLSLRISNISIAVGSERETAEHEASSGIEEEEMRGGEGHER